MSWTRQKPRIRSLLVSWGEQHLSAHIPIFIGAGMMFALSRRMLPGITYSPYRPPPPIRSHSGHKNLSPLDIPTDPNMPIYEGRWRLDECLRFATEMAGRRMRRRNTAGLALAMEKVGWRM